MHGHQKHVNENFIYRRYFSFPVIYFFLYVLPICNVILSCKNQRSYRNRFWYCSGPEQRRFSPVSEHFLFRRRNMLSIISVLSETVAMVSLSAPPTVPHIRRWAVVLLWFKKFCCRSVSVGFARKTAVFGSVFVCPVFPLSSMWYVYAAHCTSNLQQYVTYFCV